MSAKRTMLTLEDYDDRQFQAHMRSFERSVEKSALKARAEENALLCHRVTPYVKSLPCVSAEVPLYPAISYHQFADGYEHAPDTGKQEIFVSVLGTVEPGLSPEVLGLLGSRKLFISWSLPAHDLSRPERKGCGFIRAKDGTSVFAACSHDRDHYLRAKRSHCWSLHCPDCMNDTALRNGARTQDRFDAYAALIRKETGREARVSHFVISPPQEMMKLAMQTYDAYDSVVRYIEAQLMECGGIGGDFVFHPWRQRADNWELSPHFHCLLFGFIDTRRFLRNNPGWVIKKIHARERIKSVKHTMGYLQTHCGLARVEVNPDAVDWDMLVLSHFIPGLTTGNVTGFTDRDYELMSVGKGRMVGDLSDVDWLDWTMRPLCADLHHRYWGALSSKNIVTVDTYRQYKIRVCRECGSLLRVYNGFGDRLGDYVRYIVDNPIMCFARNADRVRSFFLHYKASLPEQGMTVADLTRMIPVAVSPLEYREDNGDIVVPGPFAEPDSFFLERQRRASQPSD